MSRFQTLWNAHPGRNYPCDDKKFPNQCAIRIGVALRAAGVPLSGLRTCTDYDRNTYGSHKPGHTLSAQDVANRFYRIAAGKGLGAKSFKIYPGTMSTNMGSLKDKKGMIFIMNGWGNTDHIDMWEGNGTTGVLKGESGPAGSFFKVGKEIWLWEFD